MEAAKCFGVCYGSSVMAQQDKTFRRSIVRHVLSLLDEGLGTFEEILRESLNCDPAVLLDILNEIEDLNLVSTFQEGGSVKRYLLERGEGFCSSDTHNRAKSEEGFRCRGTERRDMLGDLEGRVKALVSCLPEASPVYSQWWFSPKVYERLLKFMFSLSDESRPSAFLGCSTLGAIISQYSESRVAILDVDTVLLGCIRSHCARSAELIPYDVSDGLEEPLRGAFGSVVVDTQG